MAKAKWDCMSGIYYQAAINDKRKFVGLLYGTEEQIERQKKKYNVRQYGKRLKERDV